MYREVIRMLSVRYSCTGEGRCSVPQPTPYPSASHCHRPRRRAPETESLSVPGARLKSEGGEGAIRPHGRPSVPRSPRIDC